jgi:cytochrome d ubiquinol oxidase subunit I
VWIFGWDRLSKGLHAAAIWLVAIGTNLSALWILIANSFMQQPVGFEIVNGRAVMTDFFSLVLNPNVWVMVPHTITAGFATGAFFVLGISAYHLLRKSDIDVFRRSFQIAAIFGAISVVLVILNGHSQAQHMVEIQPMKMAAAEALWTSADPAPLSLLTIGDLSQRREIWSLRLPNALSLLAFNQLYGEVKGIYDLQAEYEARYGPGDYIPPVAFVYWSFRAMVGAGFLMLALALYALFLVMGESVAGRPSALKFFPFAIFLPYLANTTGWLMTEIGRVPWVVFGLMKLDAAVSPTVPAGMVLASLIIFTLVYAALMAADIYLLVNFARAGAPPPEGELTGAPPETGLSIVGAQE